MADAPSFREEYVSQIPAVRLLKALGYTYLTPAEALALRGDRPGEVILDGILAPWLAEHNAITARGCTIPFSEANLRSALDLLRNEGRALNGLIPTSQRVYELLTLGTTLTQTIDGDTKSYTLRYIDWQHPEHNVFTVTEEFSVEKRGSHETRRPDIVLFVNGIPLVVIECKRPDLVTESGRAFEEAVTQTLRNQRADEIPHLYTYAQILMATSVNDTAYATTETPKKYWSIWKESARDGEGYDEAALARLVNTPLSELEKQALYDWRRYANAVRRYFDAVDRAGDRLPTTQGRTLYAMLRPERLLRLAYQYIVFDGGHKKIARYQQYFAVQETVRRVAALTPALSRGAREPDSPPHRGEVGGGEPRRRGGEPPRRRGGVIWHTTGSGKSLTMVMLAKALAIHPGVRTPRVIIVTDRVNLDEQIWTTFTHCGKRVVKAKSGSDLADLIGRRVDATITTIIDKFDTVVQRGMVDPDPDVFLLVDESHRSQYGLSHARMRQVFPNACTIGFTGTPLLKVEKSTAAKFGGFIHTYSMRQAVEDHTVVPLLYEGRMAELGVDQAGIDTWFERVTRDLTDDQKLDLKRKFSRAEAFSQADQRVRQIAYDLGEHYRANFQGHGFKAQLATVSKAMALKYQRYLDEFGVLTSEAVISPPDTREGTTAVDGPVPEVEAFWKRVMDRFGSEEAYNREILASFAKEDGVELLIVVDKLLVGFDEPRNTVLYIDKPLQDHAILQAIARVNRLFEGKDFGYIIDYRGVLGELNAAMETYNALEGFDAEDLVGALTDISAEIAMLPERHTVLWAVFAPVANKQDVEALQQYLAPEDVRQRFYDALTAYARTLKVALSAVRFYDETPTDQVKRYQRDLRFFHDLRMAVRQRYAETIDYKDYELRVAKLLDTHVTSAAVTKLVEPVNIFNVEAFQAEIDKLETPAARADTIASHLKRTLTETMDRDPAFYAKFSRLIQDAIDAYRQGRIDEITYLQTVTDYLHTVQQGHDDATPARLRPYRDAGAFFGLLTEPEGPWSRPDGPDGLPEALVDLAIGFEQVVEGMRVRDWVANPDVQRAMKREMDELLYETAQSHGLTLTEGEMNYLIDGVMEIARSREGMVR